MTHSFNNQLVIAISSRALFDLTKSHQVYTEQGVDAFADYQRQSETTILEPGHAFGLVKKLLALKSPVTEQPLVEVILLSRNSADTGLRVFNSIKHYELPITRAAFTQGNSPYQYVNAFEADLFLSADAGDVKAALDAGFAAATMMASQQTKYSEQIRIAFDGDSVLFSDEAERIYQSEGLEAFAKSEADSADKPLADGPLKAFLTALHEIQQQFPIESCPIRTALVTARSAPAHERVVKTFRAWNIRIDEAFFLGGLDKGQFLKAFGADFFFDDQQGHCESASKHVATAHVPHGIVNQ